MFSEYEQRKKTERLTEVVRKHIRACLKVGKENGMTFEDIRIQLEHHDVKQYLKEENYWRGRDMIIDDALKSLVWAEGDTVKCDHGDSRRDLTLYLRKSGEQPHYGFY